MNPNDTTTEVSEVLQPSALHALERASIDTQVATAHQYPRSLEQFKKRALSMACLDSETAESCIYCRPVGKEKNDRGQWVEKFAEGPSIRLAEIVGCSYGNLRVASRIVEQTPRYVKCEGVCHDLESNYAGKSEIMETTVTKEGQPYSERQRALIAKVALAKAYRDAIFKVVPRALCKPVLDAAKKVATGETKTLDERRKKAQAWIGTLKIDQARVFAALNVAGWAEITDDHLTILTGLKTATKEGDVSIDEAFPPIAKTPEQTGPPASHAKKPQEAPKAAQTTPAPATAAPAPASAQQPATEAASQGSDEAAEAAAGLAPAQTAQPAANTAPWQPNPQESDALNNVRFLLHQAGRTEEELMPLLRSKKLARDDQKLADLAQAKLLNVGKTWTEVWAPMLAGQK
jgi:hypothetical protein